MRSRLKTKYEEEKDLDFLPDEGLYTPDKQLFYHALPTPLTPAQYARAEEHGINLRSIKKFSLEESVLIMRNWKTYADNNFMKWTPTKYLTTNRSEIDILQHQRLNNFWVKLCDGFPHRCANRIKKRASELLIDSFLENLDWDNLKEEIQKKYFTLRDVDEKTVRKLVKGVKKGITSTELAKNAAFNPSKMRMMASRLRKMEKREDPLMLYNVYKFSTSSGLDVNKVRDCLIADNIMELRTMRKIVKIKEVATRLRITDSRCKELLEKVLEIIIEKFQELKKNNNNDEEAWREATREITTKPAVEKVDYYKLLELMCSKIEKNDTSTTLRRKTDFIKFVETHGFSGFYGGETSFTYFFNRCCYDILFRLNKMIFNHLNREVRFYERVHCLLWGYKRIEVWNNLPVAAGTSRFDAVLELEKSNPFRSKMTRKFLESELVAKWINESRDQIRRTMGVTYLEAGVEAFILYADKKYKGEFQFPAVLHPLVASKASKTVDKLLENTLDYSNTEYIFVEQAVDVVEKESGKEIKMQLNNKDITTRQKDAEDSENEESENVGRQLKQGKENNSSSSMSSSKSRNFSKRLSQNQSKSDVINIEDSDEEVPKRKKVSVAGEKITKKSRKI